MSSKGSVPVPDDVAVEVAQWRKLKAAGKAGCFMLCSAGGPPSPGF